MHRTPILLLGFLLLLASTAGCDKASTPAATAPSAGPAAAPSSAPPPAPARDEGAARAAALAKGPGTCEEDVVALRALPKKGQLGVDPHFDRMLVHKPAYTACLVAMVRDRTPMEDPGDAPKRAPYDQGDLAYDLLAALGHIEWGECIPRDVMQQVDDAGAHVVTDWLDDRNHRRQVHRCLGKRFGF